MTALWIRAGTSVVVVAGLGMAMPAALAAQGPAIDTSAVPPDGPPGPEQPMRQSNLCARTVAAAKPNVAEPAPGFSMLDIPRAWQYSTGHGVTVAVIDTGVNPNPRLRVVAGGDYITGGDGLSDCDAHGTIVASVIAAAPVGIPMPPPKPAVAALPPGGLAESAGAAGGAGPSAGAIPPDGVAGVAPHATVVSIRQSSRAFEPEYHGAGDMEARRKAGTISTLARAIVHAANLGARVINVSVAACVSAAEPLDQRVIGAAVWYAATVKDAVVVAAAGNEGEDGCMQNPVSDPLSTEDPRGWNRVRTISSPSWFSDYVLSVGAVDAGGAPVSKSLAGPWVGVAAPGTDIVGLSPQGGAPVNAYPPVRPGERDVPFWGTSFSAAYVSGVAALVRAKFPMLTAHQVVRRIIQTAHNPARGVDNEVGYGVVDAVAALTFDVPPGDRVAPGSQSRVIRPPAAPPPPDHRARNTALVFAASVAGMLLIVAAVVRAGRSR